MSHASDSRVARRSVCPRPSPGTGVRRTPGSFAAFTADPHGTPERGGHARWQVGGNPRRLRALADDVRHHGMRRRRHGPLVQGDGGDHRPSEWRRQGRMDRHRNRRTAHLPQPEHRREDQVGRSGVQALHRQGVHPSGGGSREVPGLRRREVKEVVAGEVHLMGSRPLKAKNHQQISKPLDYATSKHLMAFSN